MKKFVVGLFSTLLLIAFNCVPANATYQVFFGNTGRPTHYSHGIGNARSVHHFGSNAAFTPANARAAGARQRAVAREKAITNAINSMGNRNYGNNIGYNGNGYGMAAYSNRSVNVEPVSRFDKSSTPNRATKSYTRNGVTYYN